MLRFLTAAAHALSKTRLLTQKPGQLTLCDKLALIIFILYH